MKTNIINKILKNMLFIDANSNKKSTKNFKLGEILEGKILKKLENYLLVELKNKGILKAYSEVPINSKNILLKVIKTSPNPQLQVISELPEQFELENIKNIFDNYDKFFNSLKKSKLFKAIAINDNDFNNVENLAEKIKELPKKIGLTYEKDIFDKKFHDSLKKEALQTNDNSLLNYIETNQKLNSNMLLTFPLFLNNIKNFSEGFIGFKKNAKNKKIFTIIIDLELTNNTNIQTFIINEDKILQLSFLSNNQEILNGLKKDIIELKEKIHNLDFNIINISFSTLNLDQQFENILNFFHLENSKFIDIKT